MDDAPKSMMIPSTKSKMGSDFSGTSEDPNTDADADADDGIRMASELWQSSARLCLQLDVIF